MGFQVGRSAAMSDSRKARGCGRSKSPREIVLRVYGDTRLLDRGAFQGEARIRAQRHSIRMTSEFSVAADRAGGDRRSQQR